jgi:cell division protein ZapE
MLSIDELLESLRERPRTSDLLRDFVPPPRFADKRFDNYHPRHPSQSEGVEKLSGIPGRLARRRQTKPFSFFGRRSTPDEPRGVYLDGGFGVGKTHLLAALWNESADPKAYLTFDELMYFIGMVGTGRAVEAFTGYRLLAVDEWELDDPGNLKMALAYLRGVLADEVFVAVTSNTLPLELGAGRFSQKDFRAEVEELASSFEVIRVAGSDYRHRHFEADPGRGFFTDPLRLELAAKSATDGMVVPFRILLDGLARVHPIRYRDLVRRLKVLLVQDVDRIALLPDALRWVHLIDAVYDSGLPLVASGSIPLVELFPVDALRGPYGKKLSRCLSRMEELLGEGGGKESPVAAEGD